MPSGLLGVSGGQVVRSLAKEMTNPWASETVFAENSTSLQIWEKTQEGFGNRATARPTFPRGLVQRNSTNSFPNWVLGMNFMSVAPALGKLRQEDLPQV